MRRDESEETLRLSEALRRGPEELVDRSDATCAKPFLKKKGRSLTSWVKQRSLAKPASFSRHVKFERVLGILWPNNREEVRSRFGLGADSRVCV